MIWALEQGNKAMNDKDYLYDLLVHDLRGPLSVVAATAGSLLNRVESYGPLTEAQKSSLLRIQRNAKRAQIILNEILDVGRSEEHLFDENLFSFGAVVKESVINALESTGGGPDESLRASTITEAFRRFLGEFAISVVITGRFEKEQFLHDQRKIQLIIENLVSNALKYRRKALQVLINGDDEAMITVSDDGPGIPMKEQGVVYGRFSQCDIGDRPPAQGLGLGLYCVKSMIENMGGSISLNSSEEKGTTFVVRIPRLRKSQGRGR
jgi:two-component system, OmpR family, sensor kinase